jgi:hypothetical protein
VSESIKEMTEAAVQEVKETEVELRARMAGARAARTVQSPAQVESPRLIRPRPTGRPVSRE